MFMVCSSRAVTAWARAFHPNWARVHSTIIDFDSFPLTTKRTGAGPSGSLVPTGRHDSVFRLADLERRSLGPSFCAHSRPLCHARYCALLNRPELPRVPSASRRLAHFADSTAARSITLRRAAWAHHPEGSRRLRRCRWSPAHSIALPRRQQSVPSAERAPMPARRVSMLVAVEILVDVARSVRTSGL